VKRIIRKDVSGKKMRVATTFTGAVLAATAFTPVVAPAAHASTLRRASCAGLPTWLHIHDAPLGFSNCWGGWGGISLSVYEDANGYCGGNNFGWLGWTAVAGPDPAKHIPFRQGTKYAGPGPYSEVSAVHISGWKGNDKC
jgi:hypothetical protein